MQGFLFPVINLSIWKKISVVVQRFDFLYASSPRFFIGYWILQRGWVSTRPLLFAPLAKGNAISPIHLPSFQSPTFKLPLWGV